MSNEQTLRIQIVEMLLRLGQLTPAAAVEDAKLVEKFVLGPKRRAERAEKRLSEKNKAVLRGDYVSFSDMFESEPYRQLEFTAVRMPCISSGQVEWKDLETGQITSIFWNRQRNLYKMAKLPVQAVAA